jgi:hypothetical protein
LHLEELPGLAQEVGSIAQEEAAQEMRKNKAGGLVALTKVSSDSDEKDRQAEGFGSFA